MTKLITLIALNKQGASVSFTARSKAQAYRDFTSVYDRKGWKIQYFVDYEGDE